MNQATPLLALVGIVGGALGIVGLLGASAAVIRSSSVKANLELLRGEVADLTASNVRLETSNARLGGENSQLLGEVAVLRELVTGRAAVADLAVIVSGVEVLLRQNQKLLETIAGRLAT